MTRRDNPFRPLGDPKTHLMRVRRMARAARCDLAEAQAQGALSRDQWANMVQRCRTCTWEGCDRWLDRADTNAKSLPRRCLNGAKLAALGHPVPDPD